MLHADGVTRCWWPGEDALYLRYHDDEWGKPVREDRRLFEKVCLEGFQAGLSWITILRKREHFRTAFADFDVDRVACFTARDVARLLKNEGIVRHRGKIESTINNAQQRAARPRTARRVRIARGLLLAVGARDHVAAQAVDKRRACAAGTHTGVCGIEQGPAEARVDVRGANDDLRVHAGDGAGERPSGRLRVPRRGRSRPREIQTPISGEHALTIE
jgi:hypothetical protein